jgi:hypothetical protein
MSAPGMSQVLAILCGELTQDVVEDAAVLVVVTFFRCVDANLGSEIDCVAGFRCCSNSHGFCARIGLTRNDKLFLPSQSKRLGILTIKKLQWQYAHTNQI